MSAERCPECGSSDVELVDMKTLKTYEVEFSRTEWSTVEVEAENMDEAVQLAQGIVEDEDFVWDAVDDVVVESVEKLESPEAAEQRESDEEEAYLRAEHGKGLHRDNSSTECPLCGDGEDEE